MGAARAPAGNSGDRGGDGGHRRRFVLHQEAKRGEGRRDLCILRGIVDDRVTDRNAAQVHGFVLWVLSALAWVLFIAWAYTPDRVLAEGEQSSTVQEQT